MPTFDGPDIAHYQGPAFPWQWCVDTYGCRFGACKMTEGTSMIDSTGLHNRGAMRAAGIRWRGMYHYARAGDPIANAQHFANQVGELEPGEFVFLDVESGMTPDVGAVVAMLEAFEELYPGRVADYQGRYFANADNPAYSRWPWILPSYTALPHTTRPIVVWQWAGGAHGINVPGVGNVDSNEVIDPAELDRICAITTAPPVPIPIPPEEQHMAYFRDDRGDGWQIWVVATDAVGNVWTCSIDKLPDRGKWELVQPLVGDPPIVPYDALAGLEAAQGSPTPPQIVVPLADPTRVPPHRHDQVATTLDVAP